MVWRNVWVVKGSNLKGRERKGGRGERGDGEGKEVKERETGGGLV